MSEPVEASAPVPPTSWLAASLAPAVTTSWMRAEGELGAGSVALVSRGPVQPAVEVSAWGRSALAGPFGLAVDATVTAWTFTAAGAITDGPTPPSVLAGPSLGSGAFSAWIGGGFTPRFDPAGRWRIEPVPGAGVGWNDGRFDLSLVGGHWTDARRWTTRAGVNVVELSPRIALRLGAGAQLVSGTTDLTTGGELEWSTLSGAIGVGLVLRQDPRAG